MKKLRTLIVCLLLVCLCATAFADTSNGVWSYRIKDGKVTLTAYEGVEKIKKLEFPTEMEGYPVTVVGDGSMLFLWLNEIGQHTELVFPESTEKIAGGFFTLGYFDNVVIPANVKEIGEYAFNVSTISGITFNGAPETLGDFAFAEAYTLRSLELPEGVKTIGQSCFDTCDALRSVTIPASLTEMGQKAFANCPALETVTFAPGTQLTTIPMASFLFAGIKSIEIPEGITTIGTNAFYGCSKLTAVTLPASLELISNDAFDQCGNITFTVYEDTAAQAWVESKGYKAKVVPAPIVLPEGAADAYRELKPGCEGEDVLAARTKMYELGYFANVPNQTDYTKAMMDYVKKFERDYNLEVDGILTPYEQAILFYVDAD